jgi:hypothetical protein
MEDVEALAGLKKEEGKESSAEVPSEKKKKAGGVKDNKPSDEKDKKKRKKAKSAKGSKPQHDLAPPQQQRQKDQENSKQKSMVPDRLDGSMTDAAMAYHLQQRQLELEQQQMHLQELQDRASSAPSSRPGSQRPDPTFNRLQLERLDRLRMELNIEQQQGMPSGHGGFTEQDFQRRRQLMELEQQYADQDEQEYQRRLQLLRMQQQTYTPNERGALPDTMTAQAHSLHQMQIKNEMRLRNLDLLQGPEQYARLENQLSEDRKLPSANTGRNYVPPSPRDDRRQIAERSGLPYQNEGIEWSQKRNPRQQQQDHDHHLPRPGPGSRQGSFNRGTADHQDYLRMSMAERNRVEMEVEQMVKARGQSSSEHLAAMEAELRRLRQQSLNMITPQDSSEQRQSLNNLERRVMSEIKYPPLPTNTPGNGLYCGGGDDNATDVARMSRNRPMNRSSNDFEDARLQMNNQHLMTDRDVMQKIMASTKTHEEVMMMAARNLQNRGMEEGGERDGRQFSPPLEHQQHSQQSMQHRAQMQQAGDGRQFSPPPQQQQSHQSMHHRAQGPMTPRAQLQFLQEQQRRLDEEEMMLLAARRELQSKATTERHQMQAQYQQQHPMPPSRPMPHHQEPHHFRNHQGSHMSPSMQPANTTARHERMLRELEEKVEQETALAEAAQAAGLRDTLGSEDGAQGSSGGGIRRNSRASAA